MKTSPATAMHAHATTSGVFEVTDPVMYPTSTLAGTWARFITLLEMPIASPCRPGSADREMRLDWFAMIRPLKNVNTGMMA